MTDNAHTAGKKRPSGDGSRCAAAGMVHIATGIPVPAARLVTPVSTPSPPSSVLITPADTTPLTSYFRHHISGTQVASDNLQIIEQIWRGVAQSIVMTDAEGIVRCANPAFLSLTGYKSEREAVGHSIRSFLEQPTEMDGVIRRLKERCVCSRRITGRTRAGQLVPLKVTASPVFSADGVLVYMIFSLDDISNALETEKLRHQAEAEHLALVLNQTRLTAIAELGYALNDPLQALLGLAEADGRADYQAQLDQVIQIVRRFYSEYEARLQGAVPATAEPVLPPEEPPSPAKCTEAAAPSAAVPVAGELTPCVPDAVLVADDEPMIRRLFERMLVEAFPGLRVDHAENGRAAVEAFSRGHHAVIVMDVMMPEMRGEIAWNHIAEFCGTHQWAVPHCVFCTGYMPSDAINTITRDKHHAVLRKPVTRNAIMDVMQQYLGRTPEG